MPVNIDRVIRKNLHRLRKPGVLTVRPGYEISNHQLTGRPAIVATVHTKRAGLPKDELLPETIEKVPVDVREASAHQRLRADDPAAAAVAQAYGRQADKEPSWPLEREMPSGRLLDDPKSATQKALVQRMAQQPAMERALKAQAAKPQIPYVPAANTPLDPIVTTTTITAHVSPDAGLATLEAFLNGTQRSLVVGMYDFTSGGILKSFESVLSGTKTLQMVLDNPAPNPTRDQTDAQTVQNLDQALGSRAKIARALVQSDTFASAWMFPYAYHIKVIVRDGSAFWLSSGNLNNSNQPDLASPPSTEDRDWHVIIEDAQLAKVFAAFLNQDFVSASQHQAGQAGDVTAAVADARAKAAAASNPPPPPALKAKKAGLVPAKVFKNISLKITPLLTPDTLAGDATKGQYLTNILKLIDGAQKRLYIQLQYIESSDGTGDYDTLLRAIAGRVAAGVDVRLIESLEYGEKWAEKMKAAGVDLTANISLQPDVHNKGFVVDSRTAVVSSQNFSPAGIRENRDAGVILENANIAQYFEAIFLADWKNKAKPFAPAAGGGAPKPAAGAKGTAKKKAGGRR
ncbi:MAG TPA: phospholipase D-like domain-containing protein [Bryobacteraceae bacterium]|nr:phospholipase D-like domain-containing protein [Bryobacteraceae bacterium]